MNSFYKKNILFFAFLNFVSLQAQSDCNKLDQNGKKHGFWKGQHQESKRPRYEGNFEHGKELGVFNYFDDTKAQSIIATRTFNATDNSVYTIFYDQNHNVVSEGKVVNKLFEGTWKYYHQNSKEIMTLENYRDGKLEGLRSVFFLNSKIAEETIYKKGIRDGVYKKYTEKGIVLESATYKNGEYNGVSIYKDPDGNIVAKGNFNNGVKVGIWQFFENGKLVSEDNFNKPRKRFKQKSDSK